jgi:RNA polymerase sigma factor (TIGR02999 family)
MAELNITQVLDAVELGDPHATSRLLPLVYEELRRLAAQKLAGEPAGQTLQPTALVHEAYLRLVGNVRDANHLRSAEQGAKWDSRRHFFGAAAEAMRRILVDNARRKHSHKRGGGRVRQDLDAVSVAAPERSDDLLALDEALQRLTVADAQAAELVKLRYFAGLTLPQAAEVLNVSPRTADRLWAYARAWLLRELADDNG